MFRAVWLQERNLVNSEPLQGRWSFRNVHFARSGPPDTSGTHTKSPRERRPPGPSLWTLLPHSPKRMEPVSLSELPTRWPDSAIWAFGAHAVDRLTERARAAAAAVVSGEWFCLPRWTCEARPLTLLFVIFGFLSITDWWILDGS